MFTLNNYFDGKVASLGFNGTEGKATVGIMASGEYEFNTSTIEIMTVVSGTMQVKLEGKSEWNTYKAYESFRVEKNSSFKVSVNADTAYKCVYL